MATLDLLKIDSGAILDVFKAAYYDDTGDTIQIGSDEFAAASVYAYCVSVFYNAVNNATQNRYIDTATGGFLDALAANYGINSRPDGYHATAIFAIETCGFVQIPAGELVVSDDSGNSFTNKYDISTSSSDPYTIVLYAVEAGTKYNGIPSNSVKNITSGGVYVSSAKNLTITDGGTDGFPYTQEGDDAYRAWLKTEIQSFSGAGTYAAYMARAKNADPRVSDVYVLRQDDDGYEKGKVKIYILADGIDTNGVSTIVKSSCSDESFRPIGDLVVVQYAPSVSKSIGKTFYVVYPEKFRDIAAARTERVKVEYLEYLKKKIGRPFLFDEFCSWLCKKDEGGVYAIDARVDIGSTGDFPLAPAPYQVLDIQSGPYFSISFV